MHFGYTSNTVVTESSRKHAGCISAEVWSTGPFLGHPDRATVRPAMPGAVRGVGDRVGRLCERAEGAQMGDASLRRRRDRECA
jgi:hypothetical protein